MKKNWFTLIMGLLLLVSDALINFGETGIFLMYAIAPVCIVIISIANIMKNKKRQE